ncbi:uncharacterized protein LOC111343337 isoform X4 [Stylophora pistillata]|uniref:uncharacterized protein LOC111343337 isoform X3 n=1 Tax=Stylophora pistillata TaxID=50429 RepID=UPI000C04A1C3|nr:uncharacterized protein LOC111343337 isoform X3 [Stylophora pistillata]XP_022806231.1 uncharacterized protein LOC111343337 isoform X4 [Stylophora pistillata]
MPILGKIYICPLYHENTSNYRLLFSGFSLNKRNGHSFSLNKRYGHSFSLHKRHGHSSSLHKRYLHTHSFNNKHGLMREGTSFIFKIFNFTNYP